MAEKLINLSAPESEVIASDEKEKQPNIIELEEDDFNCSPELSAQREAERRIHRLELPSDRKEEFAELLGALPNNVAIVGGAARSIARSAVTGDYEPVRDIDLVEIFLLDEESSLDEETYWGLSYRFMPDDTEHGHPMGRRTFESCFLECDSTLNQCAVIDGELFVSEAAIHDFESGVIRPSTHEKPFADQPISGRVAIRMIMLKIVSEQASGREYELVDCEPCGRYSFELAVALNKTMSRGRSAAEAFTRELVSSGLIDERYSSDPVGLAKHMFESGEIVNFEYRDNAEDKDKRPVSLRERAQRAMRSYYVSSPALRDVMSEYDYDVEGDYYTDAEYAEINDCCDWIEPSYDEIDDWDDDDDYDYYDEDEVESSDDFDEEYVDDSDEENFDEDAVELSEA